MKLFVIALIIVVFNVPFGYWRASVKKFSLQWILAIHLPIPFIVVLRIVSGMGWHFNTFPLFIGSFFLGQLSGSTVCFLSRKKIINKTGSP